MNGTGNTLTLSGSNTYTGATTISAGNLSISSVSALGSTSGLTLANATTLIYSGGAATLDRAISVTGGTGTLRNNGGALTLTGGLTKNGTTLTLDSGTFNVNTVGISGSATNSDLVIDGATVNLNIANTYNGPTRIIDGGTLTANVTNALPTSTRTAISIDATGTGSSTLALGASQSIASLVGNTTSTVTLGTNTLTIGTASGNTTYAGRITGSSSSALVKDGASTQVLSGNNSAFTGTITVNSGTLTAATANAAGGTSNVIINNGGSFLVTADDAIGSSTNVTLGSGNTTAGLIFNGNYNGTVGALTLSADSIIDLGTDSVRVIFASIAGLGSYNLSIWNWTGNAQYPGPAGGGTDQLVFTDASGFTNNLSKVSFYGGAGTSLISTSGFLTGSPSEIVAVPEPSAIIAAILLLCGLGVQFFRTRKSLGKR
jgi:autotransporter-associated beta strand protein